MKEFLYEKNYIWIGKESDALFRFECKTLQEAQRWLKHFKALIPGDKMFIYIERKIVLNEV